MNIEIDGKLIKTEADFHNQLARALGVSRYYGANLDALWDLLSAGIARPLHIRWVDSNDSRNAMGMAFGKLVAVLERVRLQDEKYGWADRFTYTLD
ncbi:MAG: barstar family protein [Rhodocyclales bacterium]|nr:barstar family protein [Rhodocyclales bacterium]